MADVAQLVRAPGCGSGGRGFETRRLPHLFSLFFKRFLVPQKISFIAKLYCQMDIIFFAALALFIFFKLSKQLGKIDEEEKKNLEEKIAQMRVIKEQVIAQMQQQEKIIGASSTKNSKSEEQILDEIDDKTKQQLLPILQSCNMSAEFFVNGAKSAFEMVIKSFASGDLEGLKMLLSDNILNGFVAAINQRKVEQKNITTNLISINEAKIISAIMIDNVASIVVRFTSRQINYVSDQYGNIIEGRKDEISEVIDTWTFKRDVTSPNPNWIISATN
jgi:predicted lipid-binding transport protein (Tim44 family)